MEQWTEVRRRVLTGELSKRAACREYQLSWHTLAKMLTHDEPPGYRQKQPRKKPKLELFLPIIHEILEADKQAPKKKQRHTATRIFQRLKDEHGYDGGYTSVRRAVQAWRRTTQEVFLPLSHPPGQAQVDFGYAYIDLAGERQQVTVVASVDQVRLVFQGQLVARHARHWGREQYEHNPVHYLALLERKPGGFDHARPLEKWDLPTYFTTLRRRMETEPDGLGTREYIRTLRLLESCSVTELAGAVEYALDIGIHDADSIRVICEHRRESPVGLFSLDGRPHLKTVAVTETEVSAYQTLLMEDL